MKYLILEDVASRFRKPCIADIKMGARTYDPDATPDKIAKEKSKYPPLEKVCFQIRGLRVRINHFIESLHKITELYRIIGAIHDPSVADKSSTWY